MQISGIFEKIEDKLFAVRIENIGEEELAANDKLDDLFRPLDSREESQPPYEFQKS